jgi:hypothetical protein
VSGGSSLFNWWLAIRFEASVGRLSNEDTHCIQDETKHLHYRDMGKYVTKISYTHYKNYTNYKNYTTILFNDHQLRYILVFVIKWR